MGPFKGEIGEHIKGKICVVCCSICFTFLGFPVFSLYGLWKVGNVYKIYVAGLGTFLDIENFILSTLCFRLFRPISDLPDLTFILLTREEKNAMPWLHLRA